MFNKKELINHLEVIADFLEYNGENPFKINAFRNGANAIRRYEDDFEQLIKEKKLDSIKGIGKALQSIIYEFYENNSSQLYNELKSKIPDSLLEIFQIKGLGPKKISVLNKELSITSIGELEYACKENRLILLKGFGKTTQEKILNEIEKIKINSQFVLLDTADKIQQQLLNLVNDFNSIKEISVTGEFRRNLEIISKIEFVILINDIKIFENELSKKFNFTKNENYYSLSFSINILIIIFVTQTKNDFISKLFFTTGSNEFINKLGIKNISEKITDEEKIFEEIKMEYVAPEMREEQYFEIQNKKFKEPSDLTLEKFKGFFHFHTTFSDGNDSLENMVIAANKLGFEYFIVCDHSKSAFYANGLKEENLIEQKIEIARVGKKLNLPILQGIESDILVNGELDYSDEILKSLDFVVASIHSRFNLSKDEMTQRIIHAVENPFTKVLGHPTGRLLLSRPPYQLDLKKVIDACAENNVAIEINANPHRLDLDWRMIFYAREKGCLFSINPDAHSSEDILLIKYGIMIARKAGLQKEEVINCFSIDEFKNYILKQN
ncbi:MAG: DNA polymerase/3'-5' exonuclease PolX [Ignavibacterium sp.]